MVLYVGLGLLLASLIFLTYMIYVAQHDNLEEKVIVDATFPKEDKLQLFFISDIHNRVIQEQTLKQLDHIDMVIIGGDLVDRRTSSDKLKLNLDRLVRLGQPIYFIPGNNDHEFGTSRLLTLLKEREVQLLSNHEAVYTTRLGNTITISGLDPYYLGPKERMGLEVKEASYELLCIHDPLVFNQMNSAEKNRFHLVLTGHTHGGQIRLGQLGPYKRGGWSRLKNGYLLVSEGYGTSLLPLRLGTRAECHYITIQSSHE